MLNQKSEEVEEDVLFKCYSPRATEADRDEAIGLILEHLNCQIVRTNATKSGATELEIRKAP